MRDSESKLRDGSEWVDHEDCIVGNEAGLRALIRACNAALESGEYYGNDLDDYVGVKQLPDIWFKSPLDSGSTRASNFILGVIILAVSGLSLTGLVTMGRALFGQ